MFGKFNAATVAIGGLVVLIIVIIINMLSGPDEETLASREALATAEAKIAALEEKVEAMAGRLDEGAAAASDASGRLDALSAQVTDAAVSAEGAAAAAAATEKRLDAEVDALHHALADIVAAGETSLSKAVARLEGMIGSGGGEAAPAEAPAAPAAEEEAEPEGSGAGEAVTFAEGLRIFISRVDGAERVARIAVNGRDLLEARPGARFESSDGGCAATLAAIRGDRAIFETDC